MRILVLGGGRFQGKRAVEMFVEAGHDVTVFNRASPVEGAHHVAGDRTDGEALGRVLRQGPFDAVIDNLAYDAPDVELLLPLLEGNAGRYVLISTFLVHGRTGPGLLSEADADLTRVGDGEYEVGKRRCEAAVGRSCPVPRTILRFGAIDGPGDPSNRRGFFIDRILDGRGVLLPSDHDQPFQPLFRDDAARAVVAAVERSVDGTLHVADSAVYSMTEWLHAIADAAGVARPYIVRLPYDDLVKLAGFQYRLPLPGRPLLDVGAAQERLGFVPTPVADWLPGLIKWWRGSGLQSAFWEQRPAEIAAVEKVRNVLQQL